MKKHSTLLFNIALLLCLLFVGTSCTREYICKCEISYTGAPGLPSENVREYPITDTKKGAQSICENNSREYNDAGIKTVETCTLY